MALPLVTPVSLETSPFQIGYDDRILLLGSCFSDEMVAWFDQYCFQTLSNPVGTLYNPASILRLMQLSSIEEPVYHDGLWHLMTHHGDFSATDREQVTVRGQAALHTLQDAVHRSSVLIATWGSAWVYERDGKVVSNCHKMPLHMFTRRMLTVDEIVDTWSQWLQEHSDKRLIITVSPIRHIKDGLHANHISKAVLLQTADELVERFKTRVSYFPAYEILLDELRDYRYYAPDMVHPSSTAVQYIWERFVSVYTNSSTRQQMQELHRFWLDSHHVPLHPDSDQARLFRQHVEDTRRRLQACYPWLK